MKQIGLVGLVLVLLALTACSNHATIKADSPDYIKKGFEYYQTMVKVTNDIKDGEKATDAFDNDFKNETKLTDWIDANDDPSATDEKELVVTASNLWHKILLNMYIDQNNIDGGQTSSIDKDQSFATMDKAKGQLEKVFKKYGFQPSN